MEQLTKQINIENLCEVMPGLYLVISKDLIIYGASDDYLNLIHMNRKSIIGKDLRDVFNVKFENAPSFADSQMGLAINWVLIHKKQYNGSVIKYEVNTSDEQEPDLLYYKSLCRPVLNSNDQITYMIYHIKDVTEFVQRENDEREINVLNDQLRFYMLQAEEERLKYAKELQNLNKVLELKLLERDHQLELTSHYLEDYKIAMDAVNIVAMTNSNGMITYVSDKFCKISKYSREELIGKDHSIVNSGYHSKEFFQGLWQTIIKGHVWKGEIRNRAKDGSIYWVDTTIIPFIDEDHNIYKYLDVRIDVTERNQALETLRVNEEKYRNLYHNSIVSIYVTDLNSLNAVEVNEVAIKLFGYTSEKKFLRNFNLMEHYIDLHQMESDIKSLVLSGNEVIREAELKRVNGSHFWGKLYMKLNHIDNTVQTMLIDITEQKHLIESVRFNEKMYRSVFENSLVAICALDMTFQKAIDVNEIGVMLFGYNSRKDFLKNFNPVDHFVHNEDIVSMTEQLKKGNIINKEIELKKRDGSHFWVTSFSNIDVENKIAQAIMVDITDRKHAEDRLLKLRTELESKVKERTLKLTASLEREKGLSEMKSQFVSIASHEFRTPLSSILSSASILEMYNKNEKDEKVLKHIYRIFSSVKNLTDILDDFLSLEQLNKGIVEVEKIKFDLFNFISNVIEEMDGIFSAKKQILNFNCEGESTIEQSKKILRNILLNLLSNASKYSDEGKTIDLSVRVDAGNVLISVKDEGLGIPKTDQENIFHEFTRAKNVQHIQGTGLGLNIVKKYIELIGGTISFTSEQGKGTVFDINIPR